MPTRVQGPDGVIIEFPDGTPQQDIVAVMAKRYPAKAPKPAISSRDKALADARKRAAATPDAVRAVNQGFAFNFADDLDAAGAAVETGARNLLARTGLVSPAGYSAGEARDAVMQAEAEASRRFGRERPVTNFAANVVGGAANPLANLAGKWSMGANTLRGLVGRGALAGAGAGAVAGAGEGRTLQERAGNALVGTALGGLTGGAVPVVVRGASELNRATSSGLQRIENIINRGKVTSAEGVDDATTQAAKILLADINRATASGQQIGRNLSPDVPESFAEALGPAGRTRLKAAAVLSPAAQTRVDDALQVRLGETPSIARRGVESRLGLAPEEAAGDVDEAIKAAQARAKPLYDEIVRGSDVPQASPILDRLMAENPYVAQALKTAQKRVKGTEGRQTVTVEDFELPMAEGLPTGAPQGASSGYLQDIKDMAAGTAKALRADGPTLNEFIAARGGLKDAGKELSGMDAGLVTLNRGMRQKGKVVRPEGRNLEDMAEQAWAAGYFKEIPTERELLEAIDQGLRGNSIYRMSSDGSGAQRARYLQELDERINKLDVSGDATKREIADALAEDDAFSQSLDELAETGGVYPGEVPVEMRTREVPTLELMDQVKRALDDAESEAVSKANAGRSGDLVPLEDTRARLVAALDELNPRYAEARVAGGEAPKLRAAFKDLPRKMSSTTNAYEFQKWVGDLSETEKRAALSAVADMVNMAAGGKAARDVSGNVGLSQFTTDNFREKLKLLMPRLMPDGRRGEQAASDFVALMRDLNQSKRNAVQMLSESGSQTARLLSAGSDLTGASSENINTALSVGGKAASGNVLGATAELAAKWAARARVGGKSQEVLDEYSRLLVQPFEATDKEINQILSAVKRLSAEDAQKLLGRAKLAPRGLMRNALVQRLSRIVKKSSPAVGGASAPDSGDE